MGSYALAIPPTTNTSQGWEQTASSPLQHWVVSGSHKVIGTVKLLVALTFRQACAQRPGVPLYRLTDRQLLQWVSIAVLCFLHACKL